MPCDKGDTRNPPQAICRSEPSFAYTRIYEVCTSLGGFLRADLLKVAHKYYSKCIYDSAGCESVI